MRLVVEPGPLITVVIPPDCSAAEGQAFLRANGAWIERQIRRYQRAMPPPTLDSLPFRGVELKVRYTAGSRSRVWREAAILHVSAPAEEKREAVLAWYRDEARAALNSSAHYWAERMRLTFNALRVKDQRTRWGSCSTRGNLNFSWRLVMAPPAVLEYVVIHELAHLRHPHHGPEFWREVDRHCPDRRRQQMWLREHGGRLALILRPA